MSVSCFNILTSHDRVRAWVPTREQTLSDLNIIDISGNYKIYVLYLSKDGKVYLKGECLFMTKTNWPKLELLPDLPTDVRAVKLATAVGGFAILMEDGSVYACGTDFWPVVKQLCPPGSVDKIAVTSKSIMTAQGSSLVLYAGGKAEPPIDLCGRRVVCLVGYDPGYLVLLDDGILYSTFVLGDFGQAVESPLPSLHIVTGFLGPKMVHMDAALDEMICVYCDGTMMYGWGDQDPQTSLPVIAALPVFPPDDSNLTHVHISRDFVWLLTTAGDMYYISKLPWLNPDNGRVTRFKHVPSSFPKNVCHFRANWSEIFFFEEGIHHEPIVTPINIDSLPDKKEPFQMRTFSGQLLTVDPAGVRKIGFLVGDRVVAPDMVEYRILGTSGDLLCVQSVLEKCIETMPLPTVEQVLFQWRLQHRRDSDIQMITIGKQTVQIDCSTTALRRICFFKSGDIIRHEKFGEGVVVGERCECLWLKYGDKYKMYRTRDRGQLHLEHTFVSRPGVDVICKQDIQGNVLPCEPRSIGNYEPGCIVLSREHGIGIYQGVTVGFYVVSFIKDGGFCRLVSRDHPLTIKRTMTPQKKLFTCLDSSTQLVDMSKDSCTEYGVMPCDLIEINSQIALCVGLGSLNEQPVVLFETEAMIKHGLGVGAFNIGKLEQPFTIIARIAAPCTTSHKLADGSTVDLSVNTDDFTQAPFLPGDLISIDGKTARVQGIAQNGLFIKYEGTEICEPLPKGNYRLIYRILAVPSTCKTENGTGFIDLESLRDHAVIPGDSVQDEGRKSTIIAAIDSNHFIVTRESSQPEVMAVPKGKVPVVIDSQC